jgi:antitoxin component YwqK of YwqJK toxin-antitoxin module
MPKDTPQSSMHIEYHKNGSIHAKGMLEAGVPTGYWEWYRLDGTLMRSGYFENGEQAGKWITYDRQGKPVKETIIHPKKKKANYL